MTTIVYRGTAWVFIGPPFTAEATVASTQIDSLVDALTQAAKETHGHKES